MSRSTQRAGPASSLERFAAEKLAAREHGQLLRSLVEVDGPGPRLHRDGRPLVSFSSNDYLGLADHPGVVAAGRAALASGAGASRLISGNHAGYARLEAALAGALDGASALVFGSGYHTNAGVIPSLVGPGDLVLLDELSHACMHAGATLARCRVATFRHGDVGHAAALLAELRRTHRSCLVGSETVFSMDGDAADVAALASLAAEHDAWLLLDDAHGAGVLGGGVAARAGLARDAIPLVTGTLSKAFGAYGGFLLASPTVRALMVNRARTFVYSTGLPPPVVASAAAAVELAAREGWRRERVQSHARRVAAALGLPPPAAAILPIPLGEPERALEVQTRLLERGVWVPAIRPPTVPAHTARLRVSLSAAHTEEDVERLIEVLREAR